VWPRLQWHPFHAHTHFLANDFRSQMATRRLLFLIFTGSGGDKTRREEKWKSAFCSALFWPVLAIA